jgi:hypothetical protein
MTENNLTPPAEAKAKTESQAEPTLRLTPEQPRGVLQKNLKTVVYLGAVSLVIVAALVSSSGKKTPLQQASAKGQPPQPNLPDSTDNNVQEWRKQFRGSTGLHGVFSSPRWAQKFSPSGFSIRYWVSWPGVHWAATTTPSP